MTYNINFGMIFCQSGGAIVGPLVSCAEWCGKQSTSPQLPALARQLTSGGNCVAVGVSTPVWLTLSQINILFICIVVLPLFSALPRYKVGHDSISLCIDCNRRCATDDMTLTKSMRSVAAWIVFNLLCEGRLIGRAHLPHLTVSELFWKVLQLHNSNQ